MTEYALYLESGPKHRKTMVHLPEPGGPGQPEGGLLGCTAQGPTTEEAVEAAPDAIRRFLRFLHDHGVAVDPAAPFTTRVAEHVTEGSFIGNGDPDPGFRPDFVPLTAGELDLYVERLAWLQHDLLQLVRDLTPARLEAEPAVHGRPIYRILAHVAGSHAAYARYTVGKIEGLNQALKETEGAPADVPPALARVWELTGPPVAAMSETQRTQAVAHGAKTWTARRGLRRMLEHAWEHTQEIERRLSS